jgi:UDP-2,4-diacetamido-2,4,6-trideoxy-beta-L-altropyranose hydrolase
VKPEIYIRADGSQAMGLGHLVRCFALAQMLDDDFEVTFYASQMPDEIRGELLGKKFKVVNIAGEEDFLERIKAKQLVILDGYNFSSEYQKKIKDAGAKLICIDDLHDKFFHADLIINHAPGARQDDYEAQPYTRYALGSGYALLRPLFLEQAKKERKVSKIVTVLICFGGSDSKNLTQRTLQTVVSFAEFKTILVVTGSAYKYAETLKGMVSADSRIRHYHAVDERKMMDLMTQSEVAVVPASGILFEVIALGCSPLICYYTPDQKQFHDYLVKEYLVNSFDSGDEHCVSLKNEINQILLHGIQSSIGDLRDCMSHSKENIRMAIKNLHYERY